MITVKTLSSWEYDDLTGGSTPCINAAGSPWESCEASYEHHCTIRTPEQTNEVYLMVALISQAFWECYRGNGLDYHYFTSLRNLKISLSAIAWLRIDCKRPFHGFFNFWYWPCNESISRDTAGMSTLNLVKESVTFHSQGLPALLIFWNRRNRDTNMAAVSLFWDTNMAAVTSCENTLWPSLENPQSHISARKVGKFYRPFYAAVKFHDFEEPYFRCFARCDS